MKDKSQQTLATEAIETYFHALRKFANRGITMSILYTESRLLAGQAGHRG